MRQPMGFLVYSFVDQPGCVLEHDQVVRQRNGVYYLTTQYAADRFTTRILVSSNYLHDVTSA